MSRFKYLLKTLIGRARIGLVGAQEILTAIILLRMENGAGVFMTPSWALICGIIRVITIIPLKEFMKVMIIKMSRSFSKNLLKMPILEIDWLQRLKAMQRMKWS